MDYVVLARKLRPQRFDELIGQETVARILRNAVRTDRAAHAFLFAGSRGVGKTSAARILTKALNCLQPAEGEPCNACANCTEIADNASPDVYEIDAASNRGIDNIRELRENTRFAPAKCRYKTYIIDEVHMLTTESFNALLKTLEEPPSHIKFILATTNPHKVPDTIQSRCQRFDFPRIPVRTMVDYLQTVTQGENITLSAAALENVARNANGGMRDALTAVDQVTAFAGTAPGDEEVLDILGLMDTREVLTLLGAVLDKELERALGTYAAVQQRGHDHNVLLDALLTDLKDLALYQSLGARNPYFEDHPPDTLAFYEQHAGQVSADELQQLFHLFLELEGQLRRSEFAQACFEMALVKACRVQPLVGVPELLEQVRGLLKSPPLRRHGTTGGGGQQPPPDERRPAATARPRGREGGSAPRARSATGGGDNDDPAADPGTAPPGPVEAEASPAAAAPEPGNGIDHAAPADPGAPPVDLYEADALSGGGEPPQPPPDPEHSADNPPPPDVTPQPPPNAPPAEGDADDAAQAEALLAEEALCDDPRWQAFVRAVAAQRPRLGMALRGTEVAEIGAGVVRVVWPGAHAVPDAKALESLAEPLAEAFGEPFQLRAVDDTNRKAREAHTMVGRDQLRRRVNLAAARRAAEQDETVQRVLRFFPDARIERVDLEESSGPTNEGSD